MVINNTKSFRWIVWDQIEQIESIIEDSPGWAINKNGLRDMYNPNCVEALPGLGSPRSTYDPLYMYVFL